MRVPSALLGAVLAGLALAAVGSPGAAAACCTPSPERIVSWWSAEGSAVDRVGGSGGTLQNGAAFTAGKAGQAFSFDGVDDHVRIDGPAEHYPGGSFTVEGWVSTTSTAPLQMIASLYECAQACPTAATSDIDLQLVDGRFRGFVRDSTAGGPDAGGQYATTQASLADGAFHHVAFVRDVEGARLRAYVDGVLASDQALAPGAAGALHDDDAEADPFTIGAYLQAGTNTPAGFLAGRVDELALFHRALSGEEIAAIVALGAQGKQLAVTADDAIRTWAGTGAPGLAGDGTARGTQLGQPDSTLVDRQGNLLVLEYGTSRLRKVVAGANGVIDPGDPVVTVAGDGTQGSVLGSDAGHSQLNHPFGLAIDRDGDVYLADYENHRVLRVIVGANGTADPTDTLEVVAGTGAAGNGPGDGTAAGTPLNLPSSLAFDSGGSLYIADDGNHRVRVVIASVDGRPDPTDTVDTIAGTGTAGSSDDGGHTAIGSQLNLPARIAIDGQNNLFVADQGNHRVRKVEAVGGDLLPGSPISTVTGQLGSPGWSGDGGPASAAQVATLAGLRFNAQGDLYLADGANHRIRRIAAGPDGIVSASDTIETVAGQGSGDATGDGVPGTRGAMGSPEDVAFDARGFAYVPSFGAHVVRRLGGRPDTDLSLVASDTPEPIATLGGNVTVTLAVANAGPSSTSGGTLAVALPDGLSLVSAPAGCSGSGPITCTLPALALQASTTLDVVLRPARAGTFAVTGTLAPDATRLDPVPGNDVASTDVVVASPAVGPPTPPPPAALPPLPTAPVVAELPPQQTVEFDPRTRTFLIRVRYRIKEPALVELCQAGCVAKASISTRPGKRVFAAVAARRPKAILLGKKRVTTPIQPLVVVRIDVPLKRGALLKAPFRRKGKVLAAETRLTVSLTTPRGAVRTIRDGAIAISIARIRSGALPGLQGIQGL